MLDLHVWNGTACKIISTFDWFLSMIECRFGKQTENKIGKYII